MLVGRSYFDCRYCCCSKSMLSWRNTKPKKFSKFAYCLMIVDSNFGFTNLSAFFWAFLSACFSCFFKGLGPGTVRSGEGTELVLAIVLSLALSSCFFYMDLDEDPESHLCTNVDICAERKNSPLLPIAPCALSCPRVPHSLYNMSTT